VLAAAQPIGCRLGGRMLLQFGVFGLRHAHALSDFGTRDFLVAP
jgi:hypothetical protein